MKLLLIIIAVLVIAFAAVVLKVIADVSDEMKDHKDKYLIDDLRDFE